METDFFQQQPQVRLEEPDPLIPFTPPTQREELHKFMLDSKPLLDAIRHNLMGEVWDGEKWIQIRKHILRLEHINNIMLILNMYASPNIPLTDFSTKEIQKKCFEFCENVVVLLGQYKNKLEIDDMYVDMIADALDDTVHSFLNRAKENAERRLIGSTTQNVEQRIVRQQDQDNHKRGFFNFL